MFFSYHKFTKGKDLTQYKRDELTCILGKGVKDNGETLNGLNMEEYFKTKKERLKLKIDKHLIHRTYLFLQCSIWYWGV